MKVKVLKDNFNNLNNNSEQKALYDLRNERIIMSKSADKGSAP